MKTSSDPRHQARRAALQTLYAWSFLSYDPLDLLNHVLQNLSQPNGSESNPKVDQQLAKAIIIGAIEHLKEIDSLIARSAPEWPLYQIAKIDLSILRLAIFELAVTKSVPPKVAIDEAVELAKEFGGEQSSKFVNGVLGSVVELIGKKTN